MTWMAKLFGSVRAIARERSLRDPAQVRPPLEQALRDLLSDLAAKAAGERDDEPRPPRGPWILRPRPFDLELYVQAAHALLLEAERKGAAMATMRAQDDSEDECSCRCRAHRRRLCRDCVEVERCQLHVDA